MGILGGPLGGPAGGPRGDWALGSVHPAPGPIRIIRVITGLDGVSRAIGRQGAQIYASPWIG